jgi:HEPN domain-containing protein
LQNKDLARDYIVRARKRLSALNALFGEEAWADVVRESQEVVELALKGLLRSRQIEVPRIHDVSAVLREEADKLPAEVKKNLAKYCKISKDLRRDRELAFYGSEDLTPEDFYTKEDASQAKESAEWVVNSLIKLI